MASISSLMGSSSSSSIYGNRNVISGLASGLDTEALIKNMISGYETKLTKLQQTRTKTEWEQEMYRSMISKMSGFLNNYSTYLSSNNLRSKSFYTNSVNVVSNGKFADMISASGKSNSDVKVLGVKQLATAATYTLSGSQLGEGQGKTSAVKEEGLASLNGKELSVTLDGVTKKIELSGKDSVEEFAADLNTKLAEAFGEGKVKVDPITTDDGNVRLQFSTDPVKQAGSTLRVSSADSNVQQAMGLGSAGVTNYLDTSRTLESLLGTDADGELKGLDPSGKTDEEGNPLYDLKINGMTIGSYTKDTALETIMSDINSSDAGVSVTYSKATNQFQFTADETGATSGFTFDAGLTTALFGEVGTEEGVREYKGGQDAILSLEVNGKPMHDVYRTSNSFEVDGMTISLKGEFGYVDNGNGLELDKTSEAVTFTTTTNSDKIVDVIKKMVEDYNAMATEIKQAYSTMPEQRSNGEYYEPLTDEDKADMSESSIKAHEDKVKAGLLFGDRDLSNLYYQMTGSLDAADLQSIGINVNFKDGLTTLEVDEDKLRSALDTDVEHVYEVLGGENGMVTKLQDPLEAYGKTTGSKGILVEKAGSELAPSTLYQNQIYSQLQDIDKQVEKWQDYINDQIDRYTSQFTQLEQLIAQMNNQSAMLYSMGGGY